MRSIGSCKQSTVAVVVALSALLVTRTAFYYGNKSSGESDKAGKASGDISSVDWQLHKDKLAFPNSKPIRIARSSQSITEIITQGRPKVLKGRVSRWHLLDKWTPDYLARLLGLVKVHISQDSHIRMHSQVNPLGRTEGVRWRRPWTEREVPASAILLPRRADDRASALDSEYYVRRDEWPYLFLPLHNLSRALAEDASVATELGNAFTGVMEGNLWIGRGAGLTTPFHYDCVDNMYAQVSGFKRFVLFPPTQWPRMYLYPRMHPSWRMTQVDFRPIDGKRFPSATKLQHGGALEVTLGPGDVLYIPPYWFHAVSVARTELQSPEEAVSVSLSVHSAGPIVDMLEVLKSYAPRIPSSWNDHRRVACLKVFVNEVLATARRATGDGHDVYNTTATTSSSSPRNLARGLVRSKYDTLRGDSAVVGLQEKLDELSIIFNQTVRSIDLGETDTQNMKASASILADLRSHQRRLPHFDAVWEQAILDYVEDVVGHVLGPRAVPAFLRMFAQETHLSEFDEGKDLPIRLDKSADQSTSVPSAGDTVKLKYNLRDARTQAPIGMPSTHVSFVFGSEESLFAGLDWCVGKIGVMEYARCFVPSAYAYGIKGSSGIPPGTHLELSLTLLSIQGNER